MAALIGRADVLVAVAEAVALGEIDVEDARLRALLAVGPAYQTILSGRVAEQVASFDDAVARGWPIPAFLLGTAISFPAASAGDLATVEHCATALRRLFPLTSLHSSTAVGPSRCRAAIVRGALDDARAMLDRPTDAWSLMSTLWAVVHAELAVASADPGLMETASAMVRVDDTPDAINAAAVVEWARAVLDGNLRGAARAAGLASQATSHHTRITGLVAAVRTALASALWGGSGGRGGRGRCPRRRAGTDGRRAGPRLGGMGRPAPRRRRGGGARGDPAGRPGRSRADGPRRPGAARGHHRRGVGCARRGDPRGSLRAPGADRRSWPPSAAAPVRGERSSAR
jgi:hypothetical protein